LFPLFAVGVVDTGGKFAACVIDIGGKLPPVSTTPVANWPMVSTTPAVLSAKFAAGVVDTDGARSLANISERFQNNRKDPNVILGGLGEDDS
jgi:hypothetical protein